MSLQALPRRRVASPPNPFSTNSGPEHQAVSDSSPWPVADFAARGTDTDRPDPGSAVAPNGADRGDARKGGDRC
jgi:hypothetical protein